jgi:hypothetical protein
MVLELGGLEFEPRPRIFSLRVILSYKSPYGGACIAHTSGPPSGAAGPWLAHSKVNIGT